MLQPQETENLDYLKETDPIGYAVKVAEMAQREKQLAQVQAERQRIAQQQEQDRQMQMQSLVREEMQKLTAAIPEFADPAKGETIRNDIRAFGKQLGFSDQELAAVYDSRAVLTLYKAMQYDKLMASKPEVTKKVSQAPKAIKPGVAQSRDTNVEELKKLKARAKQSGRVADAASVFERFI
jgi:methionine synthase II (cobalamin-independent)